MISYRLELHCKLPEKDKRVANSCWLQWFDGLKAAQNQNLTPPKA